MALSRIVRPSFFVASTVALLSCGGGGGSSGTSGEGPVATIAVPSAPAASIPPGGALSFEGTCAAAGSVTHAWSFPGGRPAASTAAVPGPVTFASAGTYTATYRCTDGEGRASRAASQTVVVAEPGPSQFEIQLQFLGGADAYRADFQWAVDRIREIVQGPVPGLSLDEPASADCGDVPISTSPGHLLLLASVEAIDGTRGTVAKSGPCYVRTSDGLPVVGIVRLDSADLASLQAGGTLRPVILHETLHVLGFGTLWGPASEQGFDLLSGTGGTDPVFTGAQARATFRDFNGGPSYAGTAVPVENAGGEGTRDRHWRSPVFGTELMTASVVGSSPALSRSTVESLADLGYQVNAAAADDFVILQLGGRLLRDAAAEQVDLADDVLPFIPVRR